MLCLTARFAVSAPPNIIIIYTDDHGYTDLGAYKIDSNVQTPVLDSLVGGGALIVNGYSTAPQCVPSRSGLMSGRIQNTFGTRQNGPKFGAIPVPLDVPIIAERLKKLGTYKTGMIGKWHLEVHRDVLEGKFPGIRKDYYPGGRGFDEYWYGSVSPYLANFDLSGNTIAEQEISDPRNRVIVQGKAAEAFIHRNHKKPFFLYLALFGPHIPVISKNDSYYKNFPVLDYPNYSPEMDDVRRKGLALIHAIDDAVGGVMQKLREYEIEENTLIFFAGDNGAQPKFWDGVPGKDTLKKWDGSENLPLRGEKGSLWEGGIKVPMFAYWKDHISANQVIHDPVWTLDFTATTLKLAGGAIPAEFDGVDILPRLTGKASTINRDKPMFWDWGNGIAIRKGDWKFLREGTRKNLFNLVADPMELYDVKDDYPEKLAEMETQLMAWRQALPPEGRSELNGKGLDFYVTGAGPDLPVDARFVPMFNQAKPTAYPAPLQYGIPDVDADGNGKTDYKQRMAAEK